MARMVVIYRTPQNPKAFEEHYFNVHVPLAKKLTGHIKHETSKGSIVGMAGAVDPYLIATLHFESLNAIKSAFATELGKVARRIGAFSRQMTKTFKCSYSRNR